ncbi:MAG: kinase [Flavobacteriales bacterium TMED288]|nr:MAG: kinase [Flavobacteriales bacterium TMED288]|tara:strand:- start:3178 stop:4164 length:987 start_codon:yes stop_codon:yes gene_type:complete
MIICRTPFRISFFGGGTDYPEWYKNNEGRVISTTINKYSYINCRYLPPFFDYKFRIRYFKREETQIINEIKHPSVRECLNFLKFKKGVDIVHNADLPARSGLGSSSTFTVGLLHALYSLKNEMVAKKKLANEAIHVEQNLIQENVGSQDQTAAAFGGLNLIKFKNINDIIVEPVLCDKINLNNLESSLLLYFSGFSRTADKFAAKHIKQIKNKNNDLKEMLGLVDESISILNKKNQINDFGKLLHEQWSLKKSISPKATNSNIDYLYNLGIKNGAIGGKLLGAGGGGFMLFFVPKSKQKKFKLKLNKYLNVPFKFDKVGSQIVYHSST